MALIIHDGKQIGLLMNQLYYVIGTSLVNMHNTHHYPTHSVRPSHRKQAGEKKQGEV